VEFPRAWFFQFVFIIAAFSPSILVCAQSRQPQIAAQGSASKPPITYPDTQAGLKQVAADILTAQKENNSSRAQQLLESLVLPNSGEWYSQNFTEAAIARVVPVYSVVAPRLPAQLAGVFISAYQDGFRKIEAVRYDTEESACSSEPVFGAMTARKSRVPLYELRFIHGDRFKRVFAFAYVDGAFRLVLTPDFSKHTGRVVLEKPSSLELKSDVGVAMGANVQAARLVCRVQPYYPEEARMQRVSGTVRFHTIIGADGSVKELEVLSGPPILVNAAREAVSRWRYHPTQFNGEPVEVDTTIDVIFALNP